MLSLFVAAKSPARLGMPVAVCLVMFCAAGFVQASTKAEKLRAAEQLVKEALHREIYGMTADRQKLLDQAAEQSPGYAPAMWHRGYVQRRNKWVAADEFSQSAAEDPRLVAYHRVRDDYPNTVAGQLELANWCGKRGLQQQQRAHLTQVLRLDPNHQETRARLGFRRIDGAWTHASEMAEEARQRQQDRQSLAEWRAKMEEILKGLHQRSQLKRKAAVTRLLEITDPEAITAIEAVLANDNEATARLVIDVINNMPHHDAALALARQAVYSPWVSVRDAAAEKLRERPADNFVPEMLASMFTPVETRMELFRGPGRRLMYRHTFYREGQQENQLLVRDTAYRRIALPNGDGEDTLERALNDASNQALETELSVAQQNQQTAALNSRISRALAVATGQQLPAQPEQWWHWWNQYNEVYTAGDKQTRTIQQAREVKIVDRTGSLDGGGDQVASVGQGGAQLDCLAAGTLIWTTAGPIAVELIQVGDLVLSQDPETGELAYKPVLGTTIRPTSRLVKFTAGEETIETSGGHTFWVSGEGWVKARELKSGMELHGVTSTVQVSAVERSREEQTYNLIVADFNTYFVGEGKILSHDNTIRQRTNAIVPGLAAE